jgi:hypothetical protein
MLAGGNPTHHDTDGFIVSATFRSENPPPPKSPLYQTNFAAVKNKKTVVVDV